VIDKNVDADIDEDDIVIGFTHASRSKAGNTIDKDNILLDTRSNYSFLTTVIYLPTSGNQIKF